MSGIVEHVAKAVDEAGTMSSYLTKDHLHEARVRAAIKATLEYLSENVSHKQIDEAHEAFDAYGTQFDGRRESIAASAPIYMFKAMLSQALKELDT